MPQVQGRTRCRGWSSPTPPDHTAGVAVTESISDSIRRWEVGQLRVDDPQFVSLIVRRCFFTRTAAMRCWRRLERGRRRWLADGGYAASQFRYVVVDKEATT